MSLNRRFILLASIASSAIILQAEDPLPNVERLQSSPVLRHLKPNPVADAANKPGMDTVRQMYVPPGFKVELVAAEPAVHQPIAFAFDERGRIWVAEAYSYPQKQPAGQGQDKIVIFEDKNNDGQFETRKVFAEKLNLVSGFEVGYGGVWIGAAPELLFIADKNRDDVPDAEPEILLDGFGYQDTHECLNSFTWGPDGWLYGNQGVFNYAKIGAPGAPDEKRKELRAGVWRYHPIRREFEIFAEGGSNQWGLDFDERGQLFMTHCRSYWGRGGTTHVIQGGQFWNQANANYAPFIIANPPREFPDLRNYLLASARYDHGAGGAGAPGTDAIYGGHSHVGTMIYLGDNWPAEYRGHIFTHNLHGHQINQQVNRPWGSGFDTVHAGRDQFFCTDPKYVAVDLQYGPDGAVYFIDWYDQQHCHNPNTEKWDRGNGRIYRMQWSEGYKPKQVNLAKMSDAQLAQLHTHQSEWFVRTARRLLHERWATGKIGAKASKMLRAQFQDSIDPTLRLRALWTLHLLGDEIVLKGLKDPNEYVRSWTIRAVTESVSPSRLSVVGRDTFNHHAPEEFRKLAEIDPSQVVRLHLASAAQRFHKDSSWTIIEALSQHGEDREDRNIPYLLWHSLAPLAAKDWDRAFKLVEQSALPQLAHWTYWYAASQEGPGLQRVIDVLSKSGPDEERRLLSVIELALQNRVNVQTPQNWPKVAPRFYNSQNSQVKRQAQRIAGALGDTSSFPELRTALADANSPADLRKHAFDVLSRAQDKSSLNTYISLLKEPTFRLGTLNLLARFDAPEVSAALIENFEVFNAQERAAALNALSSRPASALTLLSAVADGKLKREHINSFYVRQLGNLNHKEVSERTAAVLGRISNTPAEKEQKIKALEKVFTEAPLWAFSEEAGRQHFINLCASCHKLGNDGQRIGPELTGAGRNGGRYYLENIVDPNAVIGTDFQMTVVDLKDGDTISGVIVNETPSALVLRTTTEERTVAKTNIESRKTSDLSLMPEGLLDALKEREQIELLKFLAEN